MSFNPQHIRWVEQNMPELDARITGASKMQVLDILNEVTGLNIDHSASVADSMELFMTRLKEMKQ